MGVVHEKGESGQYQGCPLTFQDGCLCIVQIGGEQVGIASRNDGIFGATTIYGALAVPKLAHSLTNVS